MKISKNTNGTAGISKKKIIAGVAGGAAALAALGIGAVALLSDKGDDFVEVATDNAEDVFEVVGETVEEVAI